MVQGVIFVLRYILFIQEGLLPSPSAVSLPQRRLLPPPSAVPLPQRGRLKKVPTALIYGCRDGCFVLSCACAGNESLVVANALI